MDEVASNADPEFSPESSLTDRIGTAQTSRLIAPPRGVVSNESWLNSFCISASSRLMFELISLRVLPEKADRVRGRFRIKIWDQGF